MLVLFKYLIRADVASEDEGAELKDTCGAALATKPLAMAAVNRPTARLLKSMFCPDDRPDDYRRDDRKVFLELKPNAAL